MLTEHRDVLASRMPEAASWQPAHAASAQPSAAGSGSHAPVAEEEFHQHVAAAEEAAVRHLGTCEQAETQARPVLDLNELPDDASP